MAPWVSFLLGIYLLIGIALFLSLLMEDGVFEDLRSGFTLPLLCRITACVLCWPMFFFGED